MSQLDAQLAAFADPAANSTLRGILRGLEKESLRVTPEGKLAQTEHPKALGSAMTHPHITTDYSEALLEFITQPHERIADALSELDQVQRYTYAQLNDELLWPGSMPCVLAGDNAIPVARYGTSNSGRMKTVYRLGLGHRYGRAMQTIAGVHYNFSMPDSFWQALSEIEGNTRTLQAFKTDKYFALIRNFRRYFWLLLYLFGAAPAVCRSFVRGRDHKLQALGQDENTLHLPYATSLRMGDLGYQSAAQQSLVVCYNNIDNYLQTLCGAITQSHPDYQSIGLRDEGGEYRQLNTSLLQIENEFYSSIRPKRTAKSGETALQALRLGGVEYVEVRCVDLNPYQPLGVSSEQLHYLDAFLLFCLLTDSPETDAAEYQDMQENQKRVVDAGRNPALTLRNRGDERLMRDWADSLQSEIGACARLLDTACGGEHYQQSHRAQGRKLAGETATPAEQMLKQMQAENKTYYALIMELAREHQRHYAERPLEDDDYQRFAAQARESLSRQQEIEAADAISFEAHLAAYYAQYRDCESCGCEPQSAISVQSGC
ncbi:glutamate--cysteine ligase [Gilvimarinus sp. SDUM040013]|uniref:Glutamate--cysteine ligase n=1 Tax=Gilvimarinus gilvus TaxID=3058038 RepID=A0ABU4S2V4_9GAMM|nr:glutamate--cysteine ligase [Gilvimarinus sp. SDUM040013]MDO3388684.1 glutamate--cysteine ligase [Gilvimarinus sp. SDUM040013]MDX6849579.1 glutamate--cysteine ligase [Gilvimarinus sp. SDUM040013]